MQQYPGVVVASFQDNYGNTVSQIELQFLHANGGRFRQTWPNQVLEGEFLLQVVR